MQITQKRLSRYISNAEKVGACASTIRILKRATPQTLLRRKNLPYYVRWYAEFVIEDRWPEMEAYIMKDPCQVYLYANYVIKGRWKEAEDAILDSVFISDHYADTFLKSKASQILFSARSRFRAWLRALGIGSRRQIA